MASIPFGWDVSYGLPLLILGGAAIGWWLTTRVALPPRLTPSAPYRSWRESPRSAAYAALQGEQYLLASYLLRERLLESAAVRLGVLPEEVEGRGRRPVEVPLPRPLSFRRTLRHLATAYRSAYLAEGISPWVGFGEWTMPRRRRVAERDFTRAAEEVESVVRALEAPA
ncbi:MAG: hypothetical protein L3K10_00490 [Thermoplasmata archaeon]|nr:hypothetical protein [Thermoplasmata archaeon]